MTNSGALVPAKGTLYSLNDNHTGQILAWDMATWAALALKRPVQRASERWWWCPEQQAALAVNDKDRTIPFRHGERLFKACTAPVEFCVLRGMDHNDPLPAEFYVGVRQFLAKAQPRD